MQSNQTVVTILGAGMMGSAMCWPLADNGHAVRLVGTPLDGEIVRSLSEKRWHPTLMREIPAAVEVFAESQVEEALQGAGLIVGGVSSFGVDWLARQVSQYAPEGAAVLSVTKGLEDLPDGSLRVLPFALEDKTRPALYRFNAIGGPCIAHELAARRQTGVVFTGRDAETLAWLKSLLETPYYHVWTSTDVVGVETCAALKNAYALAVGLAVGQMELFGPDGLANHYNPQAALFGQSCFEMRRLLALMGGGEENVSWLPGAGDLYVTVFGGRTVAIGKLLGQNLPFTDARARMAGVTLESVEIITRVARALPKLAERGEANLAHFPLLLHLDQVINLAAPVKIPWERFFER